MIYYLHGDDLFLSRRKLNLLKSEFLQNNSGGKVVFLNSQNFKPVELKSQVSSLSLLGEKKLYLVEELSKFKPKALVQLLEILKKSRIPAIFWDSKTTNNLVKLKRYFPQITEFSFPVSRLTFKFLENLYPGNQKQFFPLWLKAVSQQPLELNFYFLKKHFHRLIEVDSPHTQITGWQKGKLLAQRKKFSESQLGQFYNDLIELEFKQKTGQLATDLELPLVNLLANL